MAFIVTTRPNLSPVAVDDRVGTTPGASVAIDLLANDFDRLDLAIDDRFGRLDPGSVEIVDGPGQGTLGAPGDGIVAYTPAQGFIGEDSFTYRVRDNEGTFSNVATVTVVVSPLPIPEAADDVRAALVDQPLILAASDLLAGDQGEGLHVVSVGDAVNGRVRLEDGSIVFTPDDGFAGDASFTYRIEDALGFGDVGSVEVTVRTPGSSERPVDVLLLTDLAGSFEPQLPRLAALAEEVGDLVQATTPESRFGLASFIDQPVRPFGEPGDHVYRAELPLDDDRAELQAAIAGLTVGGGGDARMSTLDALSLALEDSGLGFGQDSARLVVVATTHRFHFDGDGTGGDFVAIDDLARLLEEQDVAPIFAVNADRAAEYQGLVDQLGRGTVVPLADGDALADALSAELARSLGLGSADTQIDTIL